MVVTYPLWVWLCMVHISTHPLHSVDAIVTYCTGKLKQNYKNKMKLNLNAQPTNNKPSNQNLLKQKAEFTYGDVSILKGTHGSLGGFFQPIF